MCSGYDVSFTNSFAQCAFYMHMKPSGILKWLCYIYSIQMHHVPWWFLLVTYSDFHARNEPTTLWLWNKCCNVSAVWEHQYLKAVYSKHKSGECRECVQYQASWMAQLVYGPVIFPSLKVFFSFFRFCYPSGVFLL